MYYRPKSLTDALVAIASKDHTIVAGGTDLYAQSTAATPQHNLMDISGLPELIGFSRTSNEFRVGAATTWDAIANLKGPHCIGALVQAAGSIGSRHIQLRGTIGGNVCNASGAADGLPPLLVSRARLEIRSSTRTRFATVEEFLSAAREVRLARNELIIAVLIPSQHSRTVSLFDKIGIRRHNALSIVMAAVELSFDEREAARVGIAVGAAAPSVRRLYGLERRLEDCPDVLSQAPVRLSDLSELSPIDDIRGTARYRLFAIRSMLNRLLARTMVAKDLIQ